MQLLCCSQCVVQWCSQTPKHVLLNLYDCTYRILFYNLCKTSLRMSHDSNCGRGNVDVNIYLIAIFCLFIFGWYVLSFKFYFGHSTGSLLFFFFAVFNKACPVRHYCHWLFVYWLAFIVDHMANGTNSFVCGCWPVILLNYVGTTLKSSIVLVYCGAIQPSHHFYGQHTANSINLEARGYFSQTWKEVSWSTYRKYNWAQKKCLKYCQSNTHVLLHLSHLCNMFSLSMKRWKSDWSKRNMCLQSWAGCISAAGVKAPSCVYVHSQKPEGATVV